MSMSTCVVKKMRLLYHSIIDNATRKTALEFLLRQKVAFELNSYRVYFPGVMMIGSRALISLLVVSPYPIMTDSAWSFLHKWDE